jgi:phospholipid/cholesterol/gamma-HCH transport system substrate-binding protein
MSRSLTRVQALVLGVVVLAGLALGAVGLFAVGGRYWPWNPTFHLRAGFPKIHGVEVGTAVRVQGMAAGEVEAIELPDRPGGDVVLRLRLKNELRRLVRADATAQIVSEGMVGGKVVEIDPGTSADGVADDASIASRPGSDLTDAVAEFGRTVQDVREGKGPLGQLLAGFLQQSQKTMQQSEKTMASVQHDADSVTDAAKRVPILGGYIEDPQALLVRPNCERNRWCFADTDLFEPDRAVLTAQGRHRIDDIAPKVNGFRQKGTEVVIVGYADPKTTPAETARTLTRQRSEAVCNYLKDQHGIHKVGWVGARKVTALGMGVQPPPAPETENLPASRVEVLVFVPQG